MDATRARRTRDRARRAWYAWHRQSGFARFLGFLISSGPATEGMPAPGPTISTRRLEPSFITTALDMCQLSHRERSAMNPSDFDTGPGGVAEGSARRP
jgi:hypothetical protein